MRALKVGDVVKLRLDCLGNVEGTQGVVYNTCTVDEDLCVGVIFENGEYDGFSSNEQGTMLERVGEEPSLAGYQFKNVMQLSKDYEAGVFDAVLG